MRFSIRSRLLLLFIGLAVGPLLVAGSGVVAQSFATQQTQALAQQTHLAERVVVEVQGFISAQTTLLEMVIQVQGLPELTIPQQWQVLKDVLAYRDLFEELMVLDHTGQALARAVRRDVGTAPDLTNYAGQAEYEWPMATATTYVGPMAFDPASGEPWLTIAAPIPNKRTGGTQGVLVAKTRVKRIWDIITTVATEANESIYILDATGRVVAHRNPSLVLRNITFALPTQAGFGPGLDSALVMLAMTPLPVGQQTWQVVVERPAAQALAFSLNTMLIVVAVAGVGLGLAGLVGMAVIRQIVQPIQKLAVAARQIRAGNLVPSVIVENTDEIGELAEAFNAMTAQTRASVEDLEQRVAELKQAQGKLRQLSSAVEQSADQVVITNTQGVIEYVNPAFEQLTHYSRAEVLGLTPAILASGEQDEVFYQKLWSTILAGHIFRGAIINRKKNGELYYAEKTISPIRDHSGVITHFVSTDKDVTERIQAEAALRASETRYRSIFENSAVGIFRSTLDGRFTIVNEALVRMLGYTTAAEVLALNLIHDLYFDPAELDHLRQTYEKTGWLEGVEVRLKKRDGETIRASFHARVLTDGTGQVTGYEGLVQDVTQRHLAEALLTLQKQILELIVTSTPLAEVLTVIARSSEALIPRSFCSILLMDRDGQHLRAGAAPSLPPSFAQALDGLVAIGPQAGSCGAAAYRGETVISNDIATDPVWNEAADWMISTYNLRASWSTPIFSRGRQVLGVFALYFLEAHTPTRAEREWVEVSVRLASLAIERQHAEDEIRLLNVELEQRVAERTEQLERANQELEAFSYSISHDLRTPVRAVNSFASILLAEHLTQLTPDGQHYLQLVQTSAHRMGQLIDDLLKFSRLSRQPIVKQPVDLTQLARQIWEELIPENDHRQIELTLAALPACQGDPALLRQVLVNLLSNALKFTRTRAVAAIQIASRHERGEDVYFIRDNGVGFDQRYAHQLFGVFQRLHTEAEFEGTGVGLALVQRILHRHGGRIWVEAEAGIGATFYFTI